MFYTAGSSFFLSRERKRSPRKTSWTSAESC